MRATNLAVLVIAIATSWVAQCPAALIFTATLNGLQQVPVDNSPATGLGTISLNDAQTQITVDLNWAGLTSAATAAHIHGPAAAGANAGVLFPFTGVPAATSGAIPEQVFAITPTQVSQLESGLYYFNIHTANFPGGEIRGQITQVPEPTGLAMIATVFAGGLLWRRFRRH
jgi:hypothetical protein